jgi:pimeloyl-ACP methyl ester carboxylesterase
MAVAMKEPFLPFRRHFHRLGKVALGVAVLAGVGSLFQAVSGRRDQRRFPPVGIRVDLGGCGVNWREVGRGAPAVILDAGLGCGVLDWSLVQPSVARITRVCSYDRPGLGWSDAGPEGHTGMDNVDRLHALLAKVGVPPPFVLVGHSFGGIDVQLFAARYPEEVAGMVLVDSSDVMPGMPHIPRVAPVLLRTLGLLGGIRLGCLGRMPPPLSPKDGWLGAERASIYSGTRHLNAAAAELAALPESLAQAREAYWSLGHKPLVVLSHGVDMRLPLISRAKGAAMEGAWQGLQMDLAGHSMDSSWVIAVRSGHFIPLEQPELVVEAIDRVVGAVRERRPLAAWQR